MADTSLVARGSEVASGLGVELGENVGVLSEQLLLLVLDGLFLEGLHLSGLPSLLVLGLPLLPIYFEFLLP